MNLDFSFKRIIFHENIWIRWGPKSINIWILFVFKSQGEENSLKAKAINEFGYLTWFEMFGSWNFHTAILFIKTKLYLKFFLFYWSLFWRSQLNHTVNWDALMRLHSSFQRKEILQIFIFWEIKKLWEKILLSLLKKKHASKGSIFFFLMMILNNSG